MAGLLDPKTRIIDAILTQAGRQQASSGGLRAKYVSFSDATSRYEGDENAIAIASTAPLGFEANSTIWDTITVETDESGIMLPFSGDNFTLTGAGKSIVSGTLTGSISISQSIVSSSIDSIKNLQVISSGEAGLNDQGFIVTPIEYTFSIIEGVPFKGEPSVTSIDDVESFFADMRFAGVPNFKFLPPVQRSSSTAGQMLNLGEYTDLSEKDKVRTTPLSPLSDLECAVFNFSRHTEKHTLAMQAFEETAGEVKKLDVIPFGAVGVSPEGSRSSLFYVGKVFEDGYGVPTFVNIFALVIE